MKHRRMVGFTHRQDSIIDFLRIAKENDHFKVVSNLTTSVRSARQLEIVEVDGVQVYVDKLDGMVSLHSSNNYKSLRTMMRLVCILELQQVRLTGSLRQLSVMKKVRKQYPNLPDVEALKRFLNAC